MLPEANFLDIFEFAQNLGPKAPTVLRHLNEQLFAYVLVDGLVHECIEDSQGIRLRFTWTMNQPSRYEPEIVDALLKIKQLLEEDLVNADEGSLFAEEQTELLAYLDWLNFGFGALCFNSAEIVETNPRVHQQIQTMIVRRHTLAEMRRYYS